MTKITYIPGEIANAAIDEHGNRKPVTRTQHIFDDAEGKSQSQVNQERIEQEATLDNKIATEKQRAEVVEGGLNTRLETVEQLAEISIGGGDAQIATGSDFTNPDATKRAKVPTVGAIVDGLNDGVYDVSKRNPTAGPNSDGKFTLEYILSNADALIPTGWRHGGMTISFVQTSDNSYVNYMYIGTSTADNYFTNVTYWEKVNLEKKFGQLEIEQLKIEDTFRYNVQDSFYICDPSGNVITKIDSNGVKAIEFIMKNGETLTSLLSRKVDKVSGKNLSTNDYTNEDKNIVRDLKFNSDTFYITDPYGSIVAKIGGEGIDSLNIRTNYTDKFYICDKNGNVIFKADKNGIDYIGKSSGGGVSKKDDGNTPSDIVLNIMYGQSLALGGFIDSGQNVSTLLQFNKSDNYLMGNCTAEVMASQQLLDQYFGNNLIPSKTNIACTGIGFANLKYMQLLKDENDINIQYEEGDTPNYYFQLLGICPAEGGASWAGCADVEGLYYRRLLKSVEYGKKLAESANKTFSVGSVCYMQGENSADSNPTLTTRKDFHDKLWVLFSNLEHDIKALTGQENDVVFLTYQLASQATLPYAQRSLNIPLAQLDIALETGDGTGYTLSSGAAEKLQQGVELIDRKNILLGAIMNSLDYANSSDHVHATNNSYSSAGAQFGVQIKRAIYDGNPISPIYPKSHKVINRGSDYILVLNMDVPVRPLVFDTDHNECESQRATLSNYGFSILNGANDIITDVYLRRGQEVMIVCSSDPTGLELTYAKDGWEHGGNLRDSQDISFNINGFSYIVHNWCPTFAITI